ncbi:hypothetical protein [Paraburkholderia sp.]|uniref:hypothetical protein n=1 Tax=Paraburkholderia sp. TaxID=1926495 RepID=UPI00238D38F1|nr:hypothetical protein [Paraburkholderia sp.]MDE1180194.1 hypothetical protein [Paraburkholderia sp.]
MYVYVEPSPKGQWGPIDGYTLEFEDGIKLTEERFPSEKLAVSEIKLRGYMPLLPKVRITDKTDTAHWQAAEAAV